MDLPRAIVFDKDGTLIDAAATWGPVFAAVVPEIAGGRAEAVAAVLGVSLLDGTLAPDSVVVAGSNAEIAATIATVLPRSAADVLASLEPRVEALVTRHAIPLAVTGRVLDTLDQQGIWMGIATNDAARSTERQLEQLGWRRHFASVLGYDSGFGTKPDPGMLHESARRAGVSIDDLVFYGDSETDRRTAAAAGCHFELVGPHRPLDHTLPVD